MAIIESAKRKRRRAKARKREEERWAAKSGPVIVRFIPADDDTTLAPLPPKNNSGNEGVRDGKGL